MSRIGRAQRKRFTGFRELTTKETEILLGKLCVQLGFCLTPDQNSTIIDETPKTPKLFVEKVLELEGLKFPGDALEKRMLEITELHFDENRIRRY
jgi:hypothetical protein